MDLGDEWMADGAVLPGVVRSDFQTADKERASAIMSGELATAHALTEEMCRLGRLIGHGA
jgi:hypothetical protein